jgi:hypothetical protein
MQGVHAQRVHALSTSSGGTFEVWILPQIEVSNMANVTHLGGGFRVNTTLTGTSGGGLSAGSVGSSHTSPNFHINVTGDVPPPGNQELTINRIKTDDIVLGGLITGGGIDASRRCIFGNGLEITGGNSFVKGGLRMNEGNTNNYSQPVSVCWDASRNRIVFYVNGQEEKTLWISITKAWWGKYAGEGSPVIGWASVSGPLAAALTNRNRIEIVSDISLICWGA